MIPILYEKTENDFSTYGIGALSDVVSCVVSEERNGQYELMMTYPISGKQYDEIQAERIIKAKAKPLGDEQLFRIYRLSKPIRGIVTIYAQHISYDLSGDVVLPFTGTYTPQQALNAVLANTGFTGHTDKSGSKTFGTGIPKSSRSMLGGTEGSVLDQWGGEYKWDNFDVYLKTSRGLDKDVVIEYGKNLTELVADHDLSAVYSELLPYATYTDDTGSHTVTGDPISITSVITRTKTLIKDFTYEFEGPMTKAQVNTKAASWLSDNPLGYETPSLTVSFINLPAPVNYPAAAATIDLCDTVTIRYTALGVDVKAKVVSCEYDTLLERYTRLTIGKPRASMADTVANLTDQAKAVADYPALWKSAIEVATQMITGNAGGNVVLHEGPDGKPFELLIMDDPDITQATKVWRWTLGGLGYSTNGYAGPYELAITADGRINADFILAGKIQDALGNNSWDLSTGYLKLKDGELNITHKKTYNHEDYDATDVSTVQNYINGVITSLTDAQWEKYDFIGDRDITNWNKTRIEQMIALQEDTVKTVVTLVSSSVDPNNGMYSSIYIPALGTSPGKGVTGTMSGASLYSNYISAKKIKALRQLLVDSGGTKTISIDDTNITLKDATYTKTITASGPTGETGSGTTSIASGSYKTLGAVDFPRGTYLIMINARFPSNAKGRREVLLSTSQDSGSAPTEFYLDYRNAVNGNYTNCKFTTYRSFSAASTTMYINAYQNSGGNQSVFYRWSYVRLA